MLGGSRGGGPQRPSTRLARSSELSPRRWNKRETARVGRTAFFQERLTSHWGDNDARVHRGVGDLRAHTCTGFGGGDRHLGPARRRASWFVEVQNARRSIREGRGSEGLWSRLGVFWGIKSGLSELSRSRKPVPGRAHHPPPPRPRRRRASSACGSTEKAERPQHRCRRSFLKQSF